MQQLCMGGALAFLYMNVFSLLCAIDEAVVSRDASDRYRTCYEEPGKQVLILYGTEYGFSEEIARKLFDNISDSDKHVEVSTQ